MSKWELYFYNIWLTHFWPMFHFEYHRPASLFEVSLLHRCFFKHFVSKRPTTLFIRKRNIVRKRVKRLFKRVLNAPLLVRLEMKKLCKIYLKNHSSKCFSFHWSFYRYHYHCPRYFIYSDYMWRHMSTTCNSIIFT